MNRQTIFPFAILAAVLFLIAVVSVFSLLFVLNVSLAYKVLAGVLTALLTAVGAYLFKKVPDVFDKGKATIWPNRDERSPSIRDRIDNTQRSLFFLGFTFETVQAAY